MYPDSMKRGRAAEDRFVDMAAERGLSAQPVGRNDNIFRHVDFLLVEGADDRGFYVDVKARKRISRSDNQPQDEEIWVELKNVRGNPGWLYSEGKLAFETVSGFVIVSKARLALLVQEKCDQERVTSAADALYSLYSRQGRDDLLTRVLSQDILEIADEVWE